MRSAVNFKVRTLPVLFGQVINKTPQDEYFYKFRALNRDARVGKMPTQERNRYLDKLTV